MRQPTPKAIAAIIAIIATALLTQFLLDSRGPQDSKPSLAQNQPDQSRANAAELSEQLRVSIASLQPSPNTGTIASLLPLAQQRREAMKQLMRSHPQQALDLAFSYAEYHSLPSQIQAVVERPFTETADFEVIAICYDKHDHRGHSHYRYTLRTDSGKRLDVSPLADTRLNMSKNQAPLQGIELDGHAVVRPQIFQPVQAEDLTWATQNLPLANHDPASDFLTNTPITDDGVYAVSGGYLFHFANSASLEKLQDRLAELDIRPGLDLGSPALLAKLKQQAAPFSPDLFFAEQQSAAQPPPNELRDLLIIRVDFPDKTETPFEKQALEDLVNNNVTPTFTRFSFNKTSVATTVTDSVFRLSNSSAYGTAENANTNKLFDDAIDAYRNAGNPNPFTAFDHIAISFPNLEFGWAGLATLGGTAQWLQGKVSPSTIVHELGHNYGLSHASYWNHAATNANSTNPVDSSGQNVEYGDPFDVMGDGEIDNGHFHMAAKQRLGWIDNSDWQSLDSPNDSGTYRLYAFDSISATGLQALRIDKTSNAEHYWVGFRQAYPGIPNFNRGAYLLWQRPGSSNNRSWLVDTTPLSPNGKNDAGIAIGRTYTDTEAGVHITPLSKGQDANGNYLDVAVNIGSFSGNQAPTGTLTASENGVARSGVAFSFSGSDPDGDPLSYHWDFGDGTVEVSSASVDHEFPVGGSYTLTLTVSDRKGGTSVHQANVEVSDPITQVTTRSSGTARHLTALAASDTLVVAGGSGGTYLSSPDGETWTRHPLSGFQGNHTVNQIIWTGGTFVSVGSDWDGTKWIGIAYTSQDGTSWSEELRTTEGVGDWGFISIADDPDSMTSVIVQSDGKLRVRNAQGNYTVVDFGLQNGGWKNEAKVVWTGSTFVLGAYDFSQTDLDQRLTLYRSPDGINWTRVQATDSGLLGWYGLSELAFLDENLMGSGFGTGLVYSEDNGETWRNNSANTNQRANLFAHGNGIYSAHGTTDNSTTQDFLSIDGRSWQPAGDPGTTYNDRIFFSDTFISVGNDGLIVQSQEFFPPVQSPFEAWIVGFTTNQTDQGALANPDRDWAPNFMEFALGSDPVDGTSIPTPPTLELLTDGKIAVSIPRFAKTAVTLGLEQSVNLIDWQPLTTTTTQDTDLLLELTTSQSFESSDAIFIRIKASQ